MVFTTDIRLPSAANAHERLIRRHLEVCPQCREWSDEHGDDWAKWFWVDSEHD